MAHVTHASCVQASFLTQIEQSKRLDDAFVGAATVQRATRSLRECPASVAFLDDLKDAAAKIAATVAEYEAQFHENRRQQVELEFGGRS
jgi:hypothetical protein